jgi:hypothetical protein
MKLRLAMAWRRTTMKPESTRGSSGRTQCGRPEGTSPFEKKKKMKKKPPLDTTLWNSPFDAL